MTTAIRRLGEELEAPVGVVLEGGYELGALARSVGVTLQALSTGDR
jgi:acetoin utilization deacetylase AcuC-like enzyme